MPIMSPPGKSVLQCMSNSMLAARAKKGCRETGVEKSLVMASTGLSGWVLRPEGSIGGKWILCCIVN